MLACRSGAQRQYLSRRYKIKCGVKVEKRTGTRLIPVAEFEVKKDE